MSVQNILAHSLVRASIAAAPTYDELARSLGATAELFLVEVAHRDDGLAAHLQQMVRDIEGSLGVCEDDDRSWLPAGSNQAPV